ncbi:MAG: pyruvate kinase [Bacteroidales bacterium]|jgi:pyruvate kinase|nr:pyruvate kinase [Bacteroidales bacterium]
MKLNPKTKIIATVGPASDSLEKLETLLLSGVDIFRINYSHGSHENVAAIIKNIESLNLKHKKHATTLCDLQGPKLRIGEVENNGILLNRNDQVVFVTKPCIGSKERLYMSYQEFPKDVKAGESILIDDGKIKLEVIDTNGTDKVTAKVIYGGLLSSRKGVNLPNTAISLPALTEKDLIDAAFALQSGVTWIGLSFVRKASDLKPLRDLIHKMDKSAYIIAKIEKPEALAELEQIISAADGIMVARGDLGVEVPFDQVPMIQKEIVKRCLIHAKPVIIATQMLESMIENFRPTRAEANDVANAVMDGADAIMLSGETSVGDFPIEAVQAMDRIAHWTENHGFLYYQNMIAPDHRHKFFLRDSICYNACRMAQQIGVKAIVVFTHSGYTAMRVASYRPEANVYVFTNNAYLLDKMQLLWGTQSFYCPELGNTDEAVTLSIDILKKEKLLCLHDTVLHIGSMPVEMHGSANMIRLSKI